MSYRIVKFTWYFNKLIIYLIGAIFVGFNWGDYPYLKEIGIIYDYVVLYIFGWLPDNQTADSIKTSKKENIKSIIYKDHTNLDDKFIIADK